MNKYLARIDQKDIVIDVIVGKSLDVCANKDGTWVEGKNRPFVGYRYHSEHNVFISPRPFPSWLFNDETGGWDPPQPHPDPSNPLGEFEWSEEERRWIDHGGENEE